MKILHLSDLHFHRDNKDNTKIIKTLKTVKTKYPKHYIVVTGDIVDDGHEIQYDNAYENLKDFMNRIFIAPGNHDFGASFYKSKANGSGRTSCSENQNRLSFKVGCLFQGSISTNPVGVHPGNMIFLYY